MLVIKDKSVHTGHSLNNQFLHQGYCATPSNQPKSRAIHITSGVLVQRRDNTFYVQIAVSLGIEILNNRH